MWRRPPSGNYCLRSAADTVAVEGGKTVPALSVARMKSFYDGTLFYKLAKEHAADADA